MDGCARGAATAAAGGGRLRIGAGGAARGGRRDGNSGSGPPGRRRGARRRGCRTSAGSASPSVTRYRRRYRSRSRTGCRARVAGRALSLPWWHAWHGTQCLGTAVPGQTTWLPQPCRQLHDPGNHAVCAGAGGAMERSGSREPGSSPGAPGAPGARRSLRHPGPGLTVADRKYPIPRSREPPPGHTVSDVALGLRDIHAVRTGPRREQGTRMGAGRRTGWRVGVLEGGAGARAAGRSVVIFLLKPIRQSISGCRNPREDVHLWP